SLTGANADFRIPMKASKEGKYLVTLYNYIATMTGGSPLGGAKEELAMNAIKNAATELVAARGKSLVVSGSNNSDVQKMVSGINVMLGNSGSTIDINNHSNQYKGSDSAFNSLVSNMMNGGVGAVICYGSNPMYTYQKTEALESGLKK